VIAPRLLARLAFALLALPWAVVQAAPAAAPGHAAVASAHPAATAAGREVLEAGGNAFAAAIATTAAPPLAEPYSSGLGGGGFYLLHEAKSGRDVMIDARERAPGEASRDMYLDADGNPQPKRSVDGALAAGIPGIPAALDHLAADYGRLPLSTTLAPAIRAARDGFPVTPMYRDLAGFRQALLDADPVSREVFLDDGAVPALGHVIRQPALAGTFERIAAEGRDGFYRGELAGKLVDGVRRAGGIWSRADLAGYHVVEREPVVSHFRGFEIVSAAPPSSGGVALAEILHTYGWLERRAGGVDDLSVAGLHYRIEAMRRAYRDRAEYLGDPDQVRMPLARLTSAAYGTALAAAIDPRRATPSASLAAVSDTTMATAADPYGSGAPPAVREGRNTTHFSILDAEGNRVAATLSVNYPFGACYVPPGTGLLVNDEMDDFAAKPGVPNAYGLVGAEANAIAPGRRPLSSMSPTFVEGPDGVAILGTPGGSRIISMVLLGILDIAAGHHDPSHWVARGRFHHQYLPDRVQYEPGALDAATVAGLTALGHHLEALENRYGNMQAVYWDSRRNRVQAASDPRGLGTASVVRVGR